MPSDARVMDEAEWATLEACLESVIPTYERMNRVMSLGQVGRWRRAVARHVRPGETVVEVGSGPGEFARLVPHARRILVDPLSAMQAAARALLVAEPGVDGAVRAAQAAAKDGAFGAPGAARTHGADGHAARVPSGSPPPAFVVGLGEHLPVREGTADHVVCAFSFRDFLDKPAGLRAMARVLRPGGRLWILDVRKPPRGPMRGLVGLHVRRVVPVLGRLVTPRSVRRSWRADPYRAFAATYEAFGSPDVYVAMARDAGFVDVDARALSLGGAMLLSARRPT